MGSKSFAAAINCMDGRTQIPVIDYVKRRFRVDHVDMITEPGPIRILAEQKGEAAHRSIRERLEISTVKHGSKGIVVLGHLDCAGNPVELETQLKQISRSIETVPSMGIQRRDHWSLDR